MNELPRARALYLDVAPDPVFGLMHAVPIECRGDTAVLMCPPFGWDEVSSYRSRREWAEHLARAGHPVLRIDLPGSGDSAGCPGDPGRLAAWTATVGSAANWLRTTTGCSRLATVGLGLGGFLACCAVADGAPIDDLILWAVPARGRNLVRELRAFARLKASEGVPYASELPGGHLEAGGFLLAAETRQALEGLDLAGLAIPARPGRRALLLDRDGIAADPRLAQRLSRAGVDVAAGPGPGYAAMMADPQSPSAPLEVFGRVADWLALGTSSQAPSLGTFDAPAPVAASPPGEEVHGLASVELECAGRLIRETPLTVELPFGQLFGVLAEPVDAPAGNLCGVCLNPGAIRRIGPNRMWVETARRWAARGVPTLRLDLEGIGDADGDHHRYGDLAALYVPELVEQVRAGLDALEARGLPGRFALVGLCSGSYWAFHAALADDRVVAAFMLNPRALFWKASLGPARDFRRGVLRPSSWPRILRGEVSPRRMVAVARWLVFAVVRFPQLARARWRARRFGEDEVTGALDRLRDADVRLWFAFSGNEPLHEELELSGHLDQPDRWPNLSVEILPGSDHTLRPRAVQRHAQETLDQALARELGLAASSRGSGSHPADGVSRLADPGLAVGVPARR